MLDKLPWLPALAAGFTINVVDVSCTLLFAAKAWEAELARQGIKPSKWTPLYYVGANFAGGIAVSAVYLFFVPVLGPGAGTALFASLLLWFLTRLYGGGHVVMGQMPLGIFATMSAGLGLGYVAGGQVFRFMLFPGH